MVLDDTLKKAEAGEVLRKDDLLRLLECAPDSRGSYRAMALANRISKELANEGAEIHAQFALNLAPCSRNCAFCSFAKQNGVFMEETRLTPEEAVDYALACEEKEANAVFLMATADYPFGLFLEMSQEIRKALRPDTPMVANVGDQSYDHAVKIKDAGYAGVYHALRLREGKDTTLSPERRRESIRNFQEAGLDVGTCVEPVGPEHTNEELAEMIEFTASFNPSYSGAARRIAIPGTEMARLGMISELRMAQIVAVTRLGVPRTTPGNCTHEPCALGAIAGANLFWAELGANPRDTEAKTEEGRGASIAACRTIYWESGWEILSGPTRYYRTEAISSA